MSETIESRDIERDGITYRVTISYDTRATPYDFDCYTREDIAAWKNNDWHYIIIDVLPIINGEEIWEAQESLGRTEYGYSPGWGRDIDFDEIINHYPTPEMIQEVRATLKESVPDLMTKYPDIANTISQLQDTL